MTRNASLELPPRAARARSPGPTGQSIGSGTSHRRGQRCLLWLVCLVAPRRRLIRFVGMRTGLLEFLLSRFPLSGPAASRSQLPSPLLRSLCFCTLPLECGAGRRRFDVSAARRSRASCHAVRDEFRSARWTCLATAMTLDSCSRKSLSCDTRLRGRQDACTARFYSWGDFRPGAVVSSCRSTSRVAVLVYLPRSPGGTRGWTESLQRRLRIAVVAVEHDVRGMGRTIPSPASREFTVGVIEAATSTFSVLALRPCLGPQLQGKLAEADRLAALLNFRQSHADVPMMARALSAPARNGEPDHRTGPRRARTASGEIWRDHS